MTTTSPIKDERIRVPSPQHQSSRHYLESCFSPSSSPSYPSTVQSIYHQHRRTSEASSPAFSTAFTTAASCSISPSASSSTSSDSYSLESFYSSTPSSRIFLSLLNSDSDVQRSWLTTNTGSFFVGDPSDQSSAPIITECNSDSESGGNPGSESSKANNEMYQRQQSSVANKVSHFSSMSSSSSSSSRQQQQQQQGAGQQLMRRTSRDESHEGVNSSAPLVSSPPDSDSEDCSSSFVDISPHALLPRASSKLRQLSTPLDSGSPQGGFKAEKSQQSNQEMRILKTQDSSISEKSSMQALKQKVETNGFSASKMLAQKEDHKQIQFGDMVMKSASQSKAASASMTTISDSGMSTSSEEKTFMQKSSTSSSSSSRFMSSSSAGNKNLAIGSHHHSAIGGRSGGGLLQLPKFSNFGLLDSISPAMLAMSSEVDMEFDELSSIAKTFKNPIMSKTESINMKGSMNKIEKKMQNLCKQLVEKRDDIDAILVMTDMIAKAWSVPSCGYDLGFNMSNTIRTSNVLEALLQNIDNGDADWKLTAASAQLLEQCLTSDNRDYVVEYGLENVINVAKECVKNKKVEEVRVGTGIIAYMFKHSEETCAQIIRQNGLKTILFECRSSDIDTLRHCACALANLSLYGGPDNQMSMIKLDAPFWLYPLAFHPDDNIKYYACISVASLVANKEIGAAVLQSGTLDLVEPFVLTHNPEDFAKSTTSHIHGQSKLWLQKLVPVLKSQREEARSLAAFHFAMEAYIKKEQDQTDMFRQIQAIEPLKRVASCPNAIASKFAAQALRMIGEEVPHKLSQQVPLWSIEDVKEWVKQIGFGKFISEFENSRVDGDLLLKLDEEMLQDDIGIKNGILRQRFLRELAALKIKTDYSSCDTNNLGQFLSNLGADYSKYTYALLQHGIDRNNLTAVTDDILREECSILNTVHRMHILDGIANIRVSNPVVTGIDGRSMEDNKSLDVFISYRRSNGSQLASLLKVHLQLRGFSVFLDVEKLEAGKFDNNLIDSIRNAKCFLLVCSPNALDRCINDDEHKDWVHREIAQAIHSKCNIIPIFDQFKWPEIEELPKDIRPIGSFNGITWSHDYQEACVDKLERFMRGEIVAGLGSGAIGSSSGTLGRSSMPHGLPPSTPQIRSPSQPRRSVSQDPASKSSHPSS